MSATALTPLLRLPAVAASIPSPPRGVLHLGILPLRAYAFCIIVGIVVAAVWGDRRFRARGGRAGAIGDVTVWAVPFGLVGGRLYHVITDNELYFRPGRNPWNAFAIWDGGLGIWGAIALGAVGAWIGCRRTGVRLADYADAVAPGVVVAQAIGRLGNYFNQELFGKPTTVPWALEVYLRTPDGQVGQATCPVGVTPEFPTDWIRTTPEVLCGTYHPTFLYELLWNLAVAALLIWAERRFRLGGGRVFWLYVAGYTAGRGWIEMLRIDDANHFLGLRINVFTSIVMFLVAIGFLIALRGRTAGPLGPGPSADSAGAGPAAASSAATVHAPAVDAGDADPAGSDTATADAGTEAADGPVVDARTGGTRSNS